jgi:phospholipid N-methyltransferase
MQQIDFLKNTLRNLKTTGTITRSSSYLCKTLISYIDFSSAKKIIELGPGDRVITKHLLDNMLPDASLYAFEINEIFLDYLSKNFADKRLHIISESAEQMKSVVQSFGLSQVDYIVSAVPFTILPEQLTDSIINSCFEILKPGGKFIQFHYSLQAKKYYIKVFKNIQIKFVPLNVPPAFVMVCEKLSPTSILE